MADGGSWRDTMTALRTGAHRVFHFFAHPWHPDYGAFRFLPFCEHVWAWGHDDQRASWLAHITVSVCMASLAMLLPFDEDKTGYVFGATFALVFYGLRELGDMVWHRARARDATKVDEDVDWQGRQKRGVDPEYDGWADFDGPMAHFLGAMMVWVV